MNLKDLFHSSLYLALQHARSRPLASYIGKLRRWERLDNQSFAQLIRSRLEGILHDAKKNVPLYATGLWRSADPSDILTWPLLARDQIISSRSLLQSRNLFQPTVCRQSSGSSGIPLRVTYDAQAAAWSWANEYRAMLWHGLVPGVDGVMILHDMFRTKQTSKLQDYIKNKRSYLANCLTPAMLDEIADYMVRRRPKLCWGLPSAVFQVVRHLAALRGGNMPRIPLVKIGGEQVYQFQRQEIENRLGAKVFATYGCTEMGAIAAECRYGSMHLFSENVYLEVMKNGRPALPGEEGDLVGTTLANRAMPLIRCPIGDQARISPEKCPCGLPHPVLEDLRRKGQDTVVAADGGRIPVSSLEAALGRIFSTFPPLLLRQVLLEQEDYQKWKIHAENIKEWDETRVFTLKAILQEVLGRNCEIEVERVPFIRREKSGKFKYVVKGPSASGQHCQAVVQPLLPSEAAMILSPEMNI